ncbi:unnamed protein product [Effrenium voratum]|nr:unnamed protein product [Effrenium voratum]CAJ1450709.1 unnamed protein product [Effrenium voratum]
MSLIDSTAAFKAHCDKIDDAGNLWNLVRSNGLRSMSQLAFAIGTPQSPPTEQEFKDFCRNINEGVDLSLGLFAQMRRLHFEASTMIVAHLRSQVSQESGQEGVRKLPNAEKVARLGRQQARLNGVSIKGELQPSHALIDLVASMCDTNSVIWVAPSKCSKREREVQQLTKEKTPVLTVEQHMLKFSGPDEEISVDTSTELHWQWAMQRRGIALDQCGLIHWDTHQKWLQQLLGLVSRDPPEGYSRVRLEQLVKADQELFTIMAEELQHTSVTLTSVPAPMDDAMTRLSHDPRVNGLIEFLQQEEDNLAWIHFAPACGTASFAVHLPAEVVRVLEENVSDEDFALAKKRVAYLCRWTKRAQELGAEEQNLKKAMPGHQCCLLQRKRLLVFQEMLDDLGYPDKHLTRDLAAGFPLSGWLEPSGVFPRAVKRPQYSVDTLRVLAKGLNASILAQLENADDRDATNQQAWRQTLEEIEKGYVWLDDDADPSKHALAKRFGLNQKNKVRVIDDCTVGGLNKTIGVVEKYRIHAMDEISAYLAWMLTRCQARCQDSNGSGFQLLGRTFDLKAAYKQFGVNPSDRDLLRIAVRDTDCGRVRFLGINSLPFGAVGSVGGFLRVSMAVWFLGMVGLRLAWCAYFDDYTIFAKQSMATNATAAAEGLFQLLGLEFARDGSKACAFSTVFRTLGVEVDLDLFSKGQVSLGHTCERRLELQEVLKDILDCGYVSSKQSESLRGRLHWFESFAFGRIANNAIKVLGNLAVKENKRNVLNASERLALTFLMERVGNARPLNLLPTSLCSWTVFTDGACEGAEQRMGSVGGVLFAPDGKCVSFFGGEAPAYIMAHLLSFSANPIYELEIIPVLIAFAYWRHRFTGASVVFYIDNDAARSACIQASGATRHARSLMASVSHLEMECQCKAWYARVPTSSNIADAPSRLCFDQVEALGAVETEFRWTEVAEALGEESIGRFP